MATNIAPDVGDLREEDNSFNVIRGFEYANRVDRKLNNTTDLFVMGEWLKLNDGGQAIKLAAAVDYKAIPVFRGTKGYDTKATGAVTLFENPSSMVVQTSNYDLAGTYVSGDLLVAKLITGKGTLVKSSGASQDKFAVARVKVVGDGFLELDLL